MQKAEATSPNSSGVTTLASAPAIRPVDRPSGDHKFPLGPSFVEAVKARGNLWFLEFSARARNHHALAEHYDYLKMLVLVKTKRAEPC